MLGGVTMTWGTILRSQRVRTFENYCSKGIKNLITEKYLDKQNAVYTYGYLNKNSSCRLICKCFVTREWISLEWLWGFGGVALFQECVTRSRLWDFKIPFQAVVCGSGCRNLSYFFSTMTAMYASHNLPKHDDNKLNIWNIKQSHN